MTNLRRLQKLLTQKKISAAYLASSLTHRYLTNYCDIDSRMLVTPRDLLVITDARAVAQVRHALPTACIIDPTHPNFKEKFRATADMSRVGIEAEHLTVSGRDRLQKILPKAALIPIDEILHDLREIKSADEIRLIERACHITHRAYIIMRRTIRLGMSEKEIAWQLEKIMREAGADALAFPSIVGVGSHSAIPHHAPTTRKLPRGGFILLDFGCIVGGYHSDMTRMIFLSPPRGKMKEIFQIVQSAQCATLKIVRTGVTAHMIDKTARDIIAHAGYGEKFTHSTGHGVGLEIHERPWINKINNTKLKRNMVITIEPGIYLPDLGGVRLEDTLAVTPTGAKILTK